MNDYICCNICDEVICTRNCVTDVAREKFGGTLQVNCTKCKPYKIPQQSESIVYNLKKSDFTNKVSPTLQAWIQEQYSKSSSIPIIQPSILKALFPEIIKSIEEESRFFMNFEDAYEGPQ